MKRKDPKVVVSQVENRFMFPPKWANRRAKKVRAHQQIAHNDAADLEDEVWHLWIDFEQESDVGEDSACSEVDAADPWATAR